MDWVIDEERSGRRYATWSKLATRQPDSHSVFLPLKQSSAPPSRNKKSLKEKKNKRKKKKKKHDNIAYSSERQGKSAREYNRNVSSLFTTCFFPRSPFTLPLSDLLARSRPSVQVTCIRPCKLWAGQIITLLGNLRRVYTACPTIYASWKARCSWSLR